MIELLLIILIIVVLGLSFFLWRAQDKVNRLQEEHIEIEHMNTFLNEEINRTMFKRDRLEKELARINHQSKVAHNVFEEFRKNVSKREAHQIKLYEHNLKEAITDARADALKKSRSVMRGQATEHLAPIMQSEWPYKDFRFMNNPIDYVIFAGASGVTDGTQDTIDEVVLLEIKTGKSSLSKVQRRIRDAIKKNKVAFVTYNPDTQTTKRWT